MGNVKDVLEKLRGLDGPAILALIEAFPGGRDGADAVQRGEKRIRLEDVIRLLVDKNGRLIPAHLGITAAVCDENGNFHLNRLKEISYAEILIRFQQFFPPGTIFVSAEKFASRAEAVKAALMENPLQANLFKRVAWPLPLPQHEVRDMGKSMQDFFLPAAIAAYKEQFPDRKFNKDCGELAGKIIPLADYNGYDRIIAKMKDGPGVAWYFPNPMQGFSVDAQREAGKFLRPYNLLLNGPFEPALALVGFTGEMARDYDTPGYDVPAVSWKSADDSLCFRAHDDEFYVLGSGYLDCADGSFSGGLVLLG